MWVYVRVHEGTRQRTWNHTSIHESTWVCRECKIVVESICSCNTSTDMGNIAVVLTWKLVIFECVYIQLLASWVEVWLKFQPNFDTTKLKFQHTLVLKFTVELDVLQCKSCKTGVWKFEFKGLKFRHGGVEIWLKFQPNFDPWRSKFGWSFNQTSTHYCWFLTEISIKIPHVYLCFSWNFS